MDIIHILWIYPHFVDIIRIGHIMSYLARNVNHVLHSFVLVMEFVCPAGMARVGAVPVNLLLAGSLVVFLNLTHKTKINI